MNDQPPAPPKLKPDKRPIIWGFLAAFAVNLLLCLLPNGAKASWGIERLFVPMLFSITALPLSALVLAIIRSTRPFGLGLLLACGLIWLCLLAICGSGGMRLAG